MKHGLYKEVEYLKEDLGAIKRKLLREDPGHFSSKDIVNALFGALFIGVTFTLKGAVISTATHLTSNHIIMIIFSTLVILVAQTYFLGYAKVRNKARRRPGQFIFKRVTTMYIVAIIVSLYLVYVFGINYQESIANSPREIFKLVVLISMPCSVGAAIPALFKREGR